MLAVAVRKLLMAHWLERLRIRVSYWTVVVEKEYLPQKLGCLVSRTVLMARVERLMVVARWCRELEARWELQLDNHPR